MKHIKIYELFNKKHKGNYLTKQDQPKNNFNEYLYDNGFGDRYYICSNCDSYKMVPKSRGGFQPPIWTCDDCGKETGAPSYMSPEKYSEYLKDKEIKKDTRKYNL